MQGELSRRSLMAGGLAAWAASRGKGQAPADSDLPGLGLIGLGNRSRRHLAAFEELGNVEVAALSDIAVSYTHLTLPTKRIV